MTFFVKIINTSRLPTIIHTTLQKYNIYLDNIVS